MLDAAEQVQVKAIVDGYNAYIKAKADSIGFAYYDPNTTLARLATTDAVLGNTRPESRERHCDIWAVRQSRRHPSDSGGASADRQRSDGGDQHQIRDPPRARSLPDDRS